MTARSLLSPAPVLALTVFFALSAPHLNAAELSPVLIESGKEAAKADFSGATLGESWAAAKGTWTVVDGALKGSELAEDKHAAVLTLKQPHTDSAIRFRFQLAGSKGFSLSYNHPKGHLFRVNVSETGVSVQTDKDKKDPASKAEMLVKTATKLKQGKWYTLLCETAGEKVVVQLNNGIVLESSHAALTKKKTGYRFVLRGESVLFDDVATHVLK